MSCTYSVAEIMIALLLLACISISICRSPACIVFTKAAPHWDGPFDSRCSAHFGPFLGSGPSRPAVGQEFPNKMVRIPRLCASTSTRVRVEAIRLRNGMFGMCLLGDQNVV
uniref:Putative secreted protein n=1 Tax=Anopheles darlingi TaxID=43151 RepID=A0A2M4D5X5_ANODA